MVKCMAEADVKSDVLATPARYGFDLRTTPWDRFTAALRTFFIALVITWLAVQLFQHFLGPQKIGRRQRTRVATAVALPAALGLAVRRYLVQYHRLIGEDEALLLMNSFRTVAIDPLQVQGIVGAGGINFDTSDTLVWKHLILIADGRRYVVSFDKETNAQAYQQLRLGRSV
jgi:hypothetical protein